MNHNILRSTPSSDPRAMEDGCRRELTRTYSDSSDITVESLYQSANAKPGQSAEWTNEKHSAYLNFLEASFVQQLHQLRSSMGLHGRCTQENISGPCSSQLLSANNRHSSDQDGRWQKIKFEVNETLFEDAADTHGMLESPRIHHFPSVGKLQTATSFDALEHNVLSDEGLHSRENTTFSFEPAGSSEQHLDRHLCHPSLDDCAMEVSDQNFVDENQRDKSSRGSTAKRLKTAGVDALSNDQVSLFGRCHSPNVTAVRRASSEREERIHHPENFATPRPRSNMHYFLRGN
ncbi:hypothetical protein ACOSP7_005271 [Xanthoceras sorbifolium]